MRPRWPWHYFASTRNQMYPSDTSRNSLQSCLDIEFHSILDLHKKPRFEQTSTYSSYDIILSYLVKNSIQRNVNRRGGKRVVAGWKKSPSFTKITKEMNQWHWRANNRYIYLENRWKRLQVFGKSSFLDLEPSTIIHADSVSFFTSTDDRIQKYSSKFGFPWTNPSVNSQ